MNQVEPGAVYNPLMEHHQIFFLRESNCTMCVLFQVNLDPSLEPEDLKGNVAIAAGTSHTASRTAPKRNFPWLCLLWRFRASTCHHGTLDNYGSQILQNAAHNYTGSISLIIILLWHRVILFITQWRVIQGDRFNLIYPICSWNPILIKWKVKKINK